MMRFASRSFLHVPHYFCTNIPVKHLSAINKYFWKYRYRLILRFLFLMLSNYFAILAAQITGHIFDLVKEHLGGIGKKKISGYDPLVAGFINVLSNYDLSF